MHHVSFREWLSGKLVKTEWTQKKLSEESGVSQNTLTRILKGSIKRPKVATIKQIEVALNSNYLPTEDLSENFDKIEKQTVLKLLSDQSDKCIFCGVDIDLETSKLIVIPGSSNESVLSCASCGKTEIEIRSINEHDKVNTLLNYRTQTELARLLNTKDSAIHRVKNTPSARFSGKTSKYLHIEYFRVKCLSPISSLRPGDILSNKSICRIFKCGPQGGMRKSHATNSLVLVSTLGMDSWDNDICYFQGMGTRGDQQLSYSSNKILATSNETGVNVHLFEFIREQREYHYRGEVELVDEPKTQQMPDINGVLREVLIFQLKLKNEHGRVINIDKIKGLENESQTHNWYKLPLDDLREKASHSFSPVQSTQITKKVFQRNSMVAAYAKKASNGVCELCGSPAPFTDKNGEPYLEIHHIVPLSEGGSDSINNAIALCPNCHRKIHVINDEKDNEFLINKLSQRKDD